MLYGGNLMKRNFSCIAVAIGIFLITIFLFNSVSYAEVKFGYVDFVQVFNNYKKTIEAEKELEKKGEKKQKERERMVTQIRKLKDKFELASENEKENIQKDINEKIKELQEFDQKTSKELLKEKDDIAKEIIKEFDALVKEIGEKEGYTVIFNERMILYGEESYDITDKVLEELNKRAR
jgi:outer membrane protein